MQNPEPLSVASYITILNAALRKTPGRIIGEISQLQMYPGRSYLFFSLKDKKDDALIKCIMWKTDYKISGVDLEEGMEVIVSGYAEVYKANGGLTLKAQAVEHVGEGALKKAYDELKKKLMSKGIFDQEKKRPLPSFPHKIGVITSRDGAVIHDFLTNIGRHGFKISLINSRVEGALATNELIQSVKSFRKKAEQGKIDVLVIIRGGGSMESLLPFNNEVLVREIANFPVPVIAGIGHDKDVTLAALAADVMVSTPTAVTAVLNDSFDRALSYVDQKQSSMMSSFRDALYSEQSRVSDYMSDIKDYFSGIIERFRSFEHRLKQELERIGNTISNTNKEIKVWMGAVYTQYAAILKNSHTLVQTIQKQLDTNNPERLLKLGYSIARVGGKVLRSVHGVKEGDVMSVRVGDGSVEGEVKKINN